MMRAANRLGGCPRRVGTDSCTGVVRHAPAAFDSMNDGRSITISSKRIVILIIQFTHITF